MARDWRDLFIVDGAPGGRGADREAAPETQERRRGMFRRLRENLRKTRQALTTEIQATLFEDLSDETWERLEEALIYADVGASDDRGGRRAARARGDRGRDLRRAGADRAPDRAAGRDRAHGR